MTKEQAIKLYESEFWKTLTDYDRVKFQLFETKLCMPFDVFHEAIEKCLKRLVYTDEFALNYDGIVKEFLGEKEAPTPNEIINLIPEENRGILINE